MFSFFVLFCNTGLVSGGGGGPSACNESVQWPDDGQLLPTWTLLGDLYYAILDVQLTYSEAWCACHRQPGDTRLAVLDEENDFSAVRDHLEEANSQAVLWVDATRPSGRHALSLRVAGGC